MVDVALSVAQLRTVKRSVVVKVLLATEKINANAVEDLRW